MTRPRLPDFAQRAATRRRLARFVAEYVVSTILYAAAVEAGARDAAYGLFRALLQAVWR